MKKIFTLVFFVFCLIATNATARNIWEHQHKPAKGMPEAIGTYSLGCAIGTQPVALDGYGWQVMRPSRDRTHAHTDMVNYITNFARKVKDELKSVLIVGDLGLAKGGPFSLGHKSHQNGLDADIWYYTPPAALKRSLSTQEREKISAVSLVNLRTKKLNLKNYNNYHRKLIKTAASFDEVDRLFVNPAIKKDLCKVYKGEDWLGKVRPWWQHEDHFHVRLKCPAESKDCKLPDGYDAIKGDGCDETLDWWFKKPTKQEILDEKKKEAELKKKPKPKLPERCLRLVGRK